MPELSDNKDATLDHTPGTALSDDDAAEILLRRFMPKEEADADKPSASKGDKVEDKSKTPPKDEEEDEASAEKPDAEDEAPADEEDQETEDSDDDTSEEEEIEVKAEHVFKIKVGDEEKKVPVKDLARLYGQEAALTKRSMEVAETRKAYEAKQAEQLTASQALLHRAQERFKPYAQLDFALLATQLPAEEYTALRKMAQEAYEEVSFLEQHTGAYFKKLEADRTAELQKQAVAAVKKLSGPVEDGGIEGWNEKLYDDVRSFAISKGMSADIVNSVVDPAAIGIMHSAMLYERGRTKGAVKTIKVNKSPKKIVKSSSTPASRTSQTDGGVKKSTDKLRATGSVDDAADVFLARMMAGREPND